MKRRPKNPGLSPPWEGVQRSADELESTGVAAAEVSLTLADGRQIGPANCFAAVADVLKVLAWAAQTAASGRSEMALSELADLVNEWAAAQRVALLSVVN